MTDSNRSRAYAQALIQIVTESLVTQLGSLQAGLKSNPDMKNYLSDPTVEFRDKMNRVTDMLPSNASQEMRKFVGYLLDKDGLDHIDGIIGEVNQFAHGGPRTTEAVVTSAVPLTDAEQNEMRRKLTREAGSELELSFNVDPELIGGVVVRVGDRVVDASVAARLRQLRESIMKAL